MIRTNGGAIASSGRGKVYEIETGLGLVWCSGLQSNARGTVSNSEFRASSVGFRARAKGSACRVQRLGRTWTSKVGDTRKDHDLQGPGRHWNLGGPNPQP